MAISRMYLGRHFLADVSAGFILGLIVSLVFYYVFIKDEKLEKRLPLKPEYNFHFGNIIKYIYFFAFPFVFLFIPEADITISGNVLAFNTVFFILSLDKIPELKGNIFQRAGRVLLAIIIFESITFLFELIFTGMFHFSGSLMAFINSFLSVFIMIYGAVKLSPILKLDK